MIRLTFAGLAFFACCGLAASPASAQASAGDLFVKVDQLENQVRQLTGAVEQLQFRNQQLEGQVRRIQEEGLSRPAARLVPKNLKNVSSWGGQFSRRIDGPRQGNQDGPRRKLFALFNKLLVALTHFDGRKGKCHGER